MDWEQELGQAERLLQVCNVPFDVEDRLLDATDGFGALVSVARSRYDIEACGCDSSDIAHNSVSDFCYKTDFRETCFPTDYFRWVFSDGLDLGEAFRVVEQEGVCILPSTFAIHATAFGFEVEKSFIVDGVSYVTAKKPVQKRVSVLLPPGVGDVYWPLVKLQSLMEQEGANMPVDAYIVAPRAKKFDSHKRSFPFLKMFPFLHSMDKVKFERTFAIWKEAYLQEARSVFRDVLGCDYFVTWNGHQRAGKCLENIDPNIRCNWDLPRFVSLREEQYRQEAQRLYGDYLVLYWAFQGQNARLLDDFSLKQIADVVWKVVDTTKLQPVLIGAQWDLEDEKLYKLIQFLPSDTVDLRGKTSIEEVFGLMRGARAVVGINSGMTIMSAVFGVKTILLYSQFYTTRGVNRDFAWNTFPPSTRRTTYWAEFAEEITPAGFAARCISVINGAPFEDKQEYWKFKASLSEEEKKDKPVRVEVSQQESPVASVRDFESDETPSVTVVCVLRSGGWVTPEYVDRLLEQLHRHLTVDFKFVTLTDYDTCPAYWNAAPLKWKWPKWWSKIELFRPGLFTEGRILYFDLDVIIASNIDALAKYPHKFTMLRPFNPYFRFGRYASGIMAWEGDYSGIYDEFVRKFGEDPPHDAAGDQRYICSFLGFKPQYVQDVFPGIYSYKRHCMSGLPEDASIVCFHGKLKPHDTSLWRNMI